jgi:Ca-activated chloride channel family protein
MRPRLTTALLLAAAASVALWAAFLARARPGAAAGGGTVVPGSSGDLMLRAQLESGQVLVGTTETHMAITVTAPEAADDRIRPPLHIALVIDRSGSMAGDKLEQAKRAARQLVEQLGPRDRVAIVAYGSEADTLVASTPVDEVGRRAAIGAIDAIADAGGTHISGGLLAGRAALLAHRDVSALPRPLPSGGGFAPGVTAAQARLPASPPSADAITRVVLISDGLATEGIVDADGLAGLADKLAREGRFSITSIGIGLDFEERTMSGIAAATGGRFHFSESAAGLEQLLDQELRALGATVASDLRLAVAPAAGVEIVDAYGQPLAARPGQASTIPLGDLRAGETRKLVLRLRVTAAHAGGFRVADVALDYRAAPDGRAARVEVVRTAEATTDPAAVTADLDREAVRHIERARTARAIELATLRYETGDYRGALEQLAEREATALAGAVDDGELAVEIARANDVARSNFAASPEAPAAAPGKRARKANFEQAHEMAR